MASRALVALKDRYLVGTEALERDRIPIASPVLFERGNAALQRRKLIFVECEALSEIGGHGRQAFKEALVCSQTLL
ncbi:MAG: hypothetical protein E6G22_09725 [Actinobacteria bacterium]|nr:MAG: hypothetical protein E6G22_09725 [Actinomycetota bacterium]